MQSLSVDGTHSRRNSAAGAILHPRSNMARSPSTSAMPTVSITPKAMRPTSEQNAKRGLARRDDACFIYEKDCPDTQAFNTCLGECKPSQCPKRKGVSKGAAVGIGVGSGVFGAAATYLGAGCMAVYMAAREG